MTIYDVAACFTSLEKITARLAITEQLASLFSRATASEIQPLTYLALGRLAPKFEGIEFQIAEKMMVRVLAIVYGITEQNVTLLFKEKGDLGSVAFELAEQNKQVQSKLTVEEVFNELLKIAQEEGQGSQERKVKGLAELVKKLDPESAKFVVRIPIGALRLGFSDMTILDALSWMETGDKSLRKPLEDAYNVSVDIGRIARVFKSKGIEGIKLLKAKAGIPIRPQQSERLPAAAQIIEKLGECALEYKLDGLRAQVHILSHQTSDVSRQKIQKKQLALGEEEHNKEVMIFSRNLENTTHMFPEIVTAARALDVESAILDGEAIGYNPTTGKLLPFQETSQRKRKHGIEEIAKTIPIKYFAFDILYLNGEDLLLKPFKERRLLLEKLIKNKTDSLEVEYQKTVQKPEEIIELFNKSISLGFEGIMAKKINSPYRAGARDFTWVKLKHAGQGMLADTIDCVVLGYYQGQGKRSGFGIGAFLVGVRKKDVFVTVAKIGTGLSDEQWKQLQITSYELRVDEKPVEYDVPKGLIPDVWIAPKIVVEIAADEITKSPIHTAGVALRFPRLMNFREDKSPQDATTVAEVEKLASF